MMDKKNPYRSLQQGIHPPGDLQARVLAAAQDERRAGRAARRRMNRPRLAAMLAAVCVLAVLTVGAAAVVGLSGGWKQFWDGADVPQNAVSALNLTQTEDGYTLAVEDVMLADSRAIALVTLSRADGGPVDPGIGIGRYGNGANLLLDGDYAGLIGRTSYSPYMSPGNTAKHWCFEYSTDGGTGLAGRTLGIQVKQVVQPHLETVTLDGAALAAAYAASPADAEDAALRSDGSVPMEARVAARDALYAVLLRQQETAPVRLPLDGQFPEVQGTVAAVGDGLGIAFHIDGDDKPMSGNTACYGVYVTAVTDTRTGARHEYGGTQGVWSDAEPGDSFQVCLVPDFTIGDLPYLQVELEYSLFDILTDKPFLLSFKAENKTERSLRLGYDLEAGGATLSLDKIDVSTLGALLTVRTAEDVSVFDLAYDGHQLSVAYRMQDGTEIPLQVRAGQYDGKSLHVLTLDPVDADGNRLFPDMAQVQSVVINGRETPLT